MKRKLYAKYNNRTKMIEFVFIEVNDDEAIYKFCQANMQAEEKNPFYNSEDYTLICLGVLKMEGEKDEVGILYEYKNDFNVVFGEIKDFQKPKYNETYFRNINVSDKQKQDDIIIKSRGVGK